MNWKPQNTWHFLTCFHRIPKFIPVAINLDLVVLKIFIKSEKRCLTFLSQNSQVLSFHKSFYVYTKVCTHLSNQCCDTAKHYSKFFIIWLWESWSLSVILKENKELNFLIPLLNLHSFFYHWRCLRINKNQQTFGRERTLFHFEQHR